MTNSEAGMTLSDSILCPPRAASGALARSRGSALFRYSILSAQLAAVLWVIRWYKLEGRVFDKLAILTWAGFTVHYFLPARWRLHFFGLLSAVGLLVIFGPAAGAWLLVLGLALIGVCHLRIPFWARLTVLLAAAVLLGVMRIGWLPFPWSAAIWPVLGSMFALRLIVYLHDLKHRSAPFSFWRSVAYFFMLPNACFLLFPVVDYQTLCRSREDGPERTRVYQTGIDWMVRGALHLILYRLIYQHLPIDTSAVVGVPQLLRYLLWPFLLYLQVSGLFHLVVGMLHLFGFDLPETNHLFYLASSFTDLWRRINIYWKDFMMKVFYYPAYFRLRKLGNKVALVLGTFAVFLATWTLHSWQWFWLRGSFLVKATDVLFWTALALLVAANVLIESNRSMARRLGSGAAPWRESLRKAFQALAVFASMCLLWSLWVSDSIDDWSSLFSVWRRASARDLRLIPLVLAAVAAFLLVALYYQRRSARPFAFYRNAARNAAVLGLLVIVGSPRGYQPLGEDVALFVGTLKSPGLNSRDAARRQRDYYEKLNDVGWDNPELAKVYIQKPADWGPIRYRIDLARLDDGLPYLELLPHAHGRHRGAEVRFNRWGMRDRDYAPEPPPDTYRIALLGSSHTFGSGVAQDQNFESLVENRLNRENGLGRYRRLEILNFATEGYTPLDVLASLDRKVLGFKPQAVLYVVHQIDAHYAVTRLSRILSNRASIPYRELLEFARTAGVEPGASEKVATLALEERREDLLAWAYRQIVERCRSRRVVPMMAYLPILTPQKDDISSASLLRIGHDAGLLTFDFSGVYEGHDRDDLQIAAWDDHPNAAGHQLVAERLYAAMRGAETSLWRNDDNERDQGSGARLHSEGVPSGGGS